MHGVRTHTPAIWAVFVKYSKLVGVVLLVREKGVQLDL